MNDDRNYTGFWVKDAITTIACTVLVSAALSACNDSTNTPSQVATAPPTNPPVQEGFSINSILNSLEGAKRDAQEAVAPHADAVQTRTKEEVEKLFRWEYKVTEFPATLPAAELEGKLMELGADGWECFDVREQPLNLTRITCKRRPKSALSYLKYIPGL
jgi:hypothetical protein